MALLTSVMSQDDNGNIFEQAWSVSPDDFVKGNLINAGFDIDGDGRGEFLLWDIAVDLYLMFEAYGDNEYKLVYENKRLQNVFDLDVDSSRDVLTIGGFYLVHDNLYQNLLPRWRAHS